MKSSSGDLLFFGDYWDDTWRRRQQFAWRLSQTGRFGHVLYVERPLPITSFLKFLIGRADRDATNRWRRVLSKRSSVMSMNVCLSVLATFALLPLRRLGALLEISERLRDYWLIERLSAYVDLEQPIVWISHPQLSVEVIETLKPRFILYDCTEDFAAWPQLPACVRAQIKATDQWLTEHADVVTAVSRTLYEEKRQANSNTYWLPNAVDVDIFAQDRENSPAPLELRGVSRPVLTFVGGLSEWAQDWDLLDRIARLRPEWTIVLIGSLSVCPQTQQMLKSHLNVLCVGPKPYRDLPTYLINSDVCFQFYRQRRENDTRNSQKIFLYLAAGKPIVSTLSADVETHRSLVEIVDTAESFISGVERALKEDSQVAVKTRLDFARANSWTVRVEKIGQILNDLGAP